MLFWIVVAVLVILACIGFIPFRLWIAQIKARHYGKEARSNIEKISKGKSIYIGQDRSGLPSAIIWIVLIVVACLVFALSGKTKSKKENISPEHNGPSQYTDITYNDEKDSAVDYDADNREQEVTIDYGTDDNDTDDYYSGLSEETNSFYETGIVFPDSSSRFLSSEEIESLELEYAYSTGEMVQYAINEIYARNGYEFKKPYWKNYYDQFNWYHNLGYSDEETKKHFNDFEKQNIKKLIEKREQIGNQ